MKIFPRVFLKSKEENEIQQGFPWVYDNEISHLKYKLSEDGEWQQKELKDSEITDGECVELYTKAGGFLGSGIINRKSKITIRLISTLHADKIYEDTSDFIFKKIYNAVNMRRMHYSDNDSYRLIFGEADLLPGFICEKYTDISGNVYLLVQFLSLSCEIFRKEIIEALDKIIKPYGIYERSDADVRNKEGLEQRTGWLSTARDETIIIQENGIKIQVDLAHGQKTGYFLDQKFNRKEIQKYCHGKTVLDAFSHTGAFGLNAFKAGAKSVVSVDISPEAVELIDRNIELNDAGKVMSSECADVFDLLKKYETEEKKFDVIILDPPAFTKSAKMIKKAYGGYKEINLRAMRLLNEGGILITCSCSHFFDANTFYSMLIHASMDSHKRVQILEKRGAGPDHPVLLGYPKSEYLKCAVTKVY